MSEPIAWASLPETEVIPGFHGRFAHSERMSFARWRIDAGAVLPPHAHPHEQVVHVFAGLMEFTMAGETSRVGPGMVLVIPPGVPHEGRALADAEVLDVFAPVREDYRDGAPSILASALAAR